MEDALKTLMSQTKLPVSESIVPDIKGMIKGAIAGEQADVRAEFPAEPSAIQSIFNTLGRPSAHIRNILAGNPETANKTGTNWSSGRDVLTNILGFQKNKKEGWDLSQPFTDPMEFALDVAGFATEVITDPLSYISFGTLNPAGKALKEAGKLPPLWKQFQGQSPVRSAVGFALSPTGEIKGSLSKTLDNVVGKVGENVGGKVKHAWDSFVPDDAKGYMAGILRRSGVPGKMAFRAIERWTRHKEINESRMLVARVLDFKRKADAMGLGNENGLLKIRALLETPQLLTDPNVGPQLMDLVENGQSIFREMSEQSKHLGTHIFDYVDSALAMDAEYTMRKASDIGGFSPRTASNLKEKKFARLMYDTFNPAKTPTTSEYARLDTFGRGIVGGTNVINDMVTFGPSVDPDGTLRTLFDAAVGDAKEAQAFIDEFRNRTHKFVSPNIQYRDSLQRLRFLDELTGETVNMWDGELQKYLETLESGGAIDQTAIGKANIPITALDNESKNLRFVAKGNSSKGPVIHKVPYTQLRRIAKKKKLDLGAIMRGEAPFTYKGIDVRLERSQRTAKSIVLDIDGQKRILTPLIDVSKDRRDEIAKVMLNPENAEILEKGVFPRDLMEDTYEYVNSRATRNAAVQGTYRAIGTAVKLGELGDGPSILEWTNKMKVAPHAANQRIFEQAFGEDALRALKDMSTGNVDEARSVLGKIYDDVGEWTEDKLKDEMQKSASDHLGYWAKHTNLSKEISQDVNLVTTAFQEQSIGAFQKLMGDYGRLWKSVTLAWPSRHFRDMVSNVHRNMEAGFISDPIEGARLFQRAHRLYLGHGDEGLRKIPALQKMVADIGLDPQTAPAEEYTKAFRHLFGQLRGGDLSIREELMREGGGIRALRSAVPGYEQPTSTGQMLVDQFKGRTAGVERILDPEANPFKTLFQSPSQTTLPGGGILRWSDAIGDYTDTVGRFQAFLAQIQKGVDPEQAMANLQSALINYDPRALNPFERTTLKQWMPFYTFWKGNLSWVAGQLLHRPGGRTGQMMRLYQNPEVQTDPMLPEWMRDTVAIPYQTDEAGSKMFITGFGLMTEDAMATLGGVTQLFKDPGQGARTLMMEGLSRVNPVPKALGEWATGVSTFQTTNEGGRPLTDMDPPIGRLLTNINKRFGSGELTNPIGLVPQGLEHFSQALPGVPRLIRAANKILDDRAAVKPHHKALNVLTGMKITTIDSAQQAKYGIDSLRDMLQEFKPVTYDLPLTLVNEERLKKLPPEEQEKILRLRELMEELQQRRKELRKGKN